MQELIFKSASKALGTYSTAVKAGSFIYFSGQLGKDPKTDTLTKGTQAQAEQIFENIKNMLAEINLTLEDIIKTTVFLTDLTRFSQVNNVFEKQFNGKYPARSCVQVSALPAGAEIEIEFIAYCGD